MIPGMKTREDRVEEQPERRRPGRPSKPHRMISFKMATDLVDWLGEASPRLERTKTSLVEEGLRLLRKRLERAARRLARATAGTKRKGVRAGTQENQKTRT